MQTLRTAKLALEEGLIDQADFDVVKTAFLKAQQIKAGMDAGFLREEDYVQARTSFLQALAFEVEAPAMGYHPQHAAPAVAAAQRQHYPVAAAAPPAPISTASSNTAMRRTAEQAQAARGPASPQAHAPPKPAAAHAPAPLGLVAAAGSGRVSVQSNSPSLGSPRATGAAAGPPELESLSRLVKAGIAAGKKSMSGIAVNEHTINVFNHIKTKSTFKWVTYKINDAGKDVVVEAVGASGSTYFEFISSLPEAECRYGVFDYAYVNETHQTLNKLVFVNWAPDNASTRTKMMYASTKDFFKGFLDGVGAELQASDMSELEEGEMKERIHQALTRK